MTYKLSDGQTFNTEDIRELSTIRDYGADNQTIDRSKIGFVIYLKKGKSIQVVEHYHFADWADVKLKLTKQRDEIMHAWHAGSQSENSKRSLSADTQ